MLKKVFFNFSLILSSIFVSGSFLDNPVIGDGVLKDEKRSLKKFNKILVNGSFDISIVCQQQQLINIEGDSNITPIIKTYVDKDVLNIITTKKYKENKNLKIKINNPDINNINIKGSSNFYIDKLNNKQINISIEGNSNLNIKGQSQKLFLDVSGSGYIDTKNLKTEDTTVELRGFSMIDVFASKSLDAKISGFGKINYYGQPKNIKKNITGAGFINEGKKIG